ncbi:hypothetical protein AB0J63_17635 [Streptosporangium canum]|uniref:hypothetical protein n=1 Tax=Streptosporangium canum TaxID=324952 RepID=UPI0034221846
MPELQGYGPADLARLRSVAVRPRGWSHRVKNQVTEYRHPVTGERIKVIRDQLGNKVRLRSHGQDAHVFLPHLRIHGQSGQIMEVQR